MLATALKLVPALRPEFIDDHARKVEDADEEVSAGRSLFESLMTDLPSRSSSFIPYPHRKKVVEVWAISNTSRICSRLQ
jgi:hypothetical protein